MYSPNASEANGNQTIPDAWTTRQLSYYPQPVEINPTSYSRAPSSYTSWEAPTYSIGSNGEPNPLLSSSIGHNKSGPLPPDFGARNSPQDPLANWYTGMDGPWIPISTIPVTSQDGMDYHWIGKTGEVDRKMRESMDVFKVKDGQTKYQKIKRGLSGFLNATRVSAIADTGSAQNVISAAYASDLKLPIKHTSSSFQLGNSKTVQSIGTVRLHWAFAENPAKKYDLLFHVLPTCIYDVILGSAFLTATETLSKYGRRLTECVFSIARVFNFGFLGNMCHRLEGVLDDKYLVLAVPDTGAERNVMDAWYAKSHGFYIDTGPGTQNVLQFADESYQETIGQVTTSWTFASGEEALLTFEVLEGCASEVIIGEDFIFEHNIFAKHESSLRVLESDSDSYELAPFDFISSWQQKYLNVKSKLQNNNAADNASPQNFLVSMASQNEQLRRDIWNHKFEFGNKASPEEMQAETKRKQEYELSLKQQNSAQQDGPFHRIPSIPTSSSGASRVNRTVTANVPNFSRPHVR